MPSLSAFFVKPEKKAEAVTNAEVAVKPKALIKPEVHEKKRKRITSQPEDAIQPAESKKREVAADDAAQPSVEPEKRKDEDINFSGKTKKGLQRAEDAAIKILEQEEAPTQEQVTRTLLLLGKDWPEQVRPNVTPDGKPVNGFVLGLVYGLGGQGMKSSKITECFPSLAKMLNAYIASSLPETAFTYSSLQINYNYAARKHKDGNNLGPSYIQALGDHTGGGLWTEDQGVVDARHQWKRFMGTKEHATQPFEGTTRISLIAFTHSAFEELQEELCGSLRDLGFMAVGSSRIRDEGNVDEDSFDDYWARRKAEAKTELADKNLQLAIAAPSAPSSVKCAASNASAAAKKPTAATASTAHKPSMLVVDCAGWACGRGSAWVGYNQTTFFGNKTQITQIEMKKNSTGTVLVHYR
jgi:hypothetical protein